MKHVLLVLATLCLLVETPIAAAQSADAVYIIFDASGSMWGQLPDKSHKVVVAKSVLEDFVSQDFGTADLALRAYGHRREGDCRDSELVVPFGPSSAAVGQVKAFTKNLNPLGKTPITYSLRQALDDFGDRTGEIILITDGIETCDEDPCALVREWKEQGIDINVHVVGFGLEEKEKASLQCIAEASGTEYQDAESGMELAIGLGKIQDAVADSGQEETPDDPSEFEGAQTVGFWLKGIDSDGNPIGVEGTLSQDGVDRFDVSSNSRNQVDAGTYTLDVGVRTANGTLYKPVQQTVTARGDDDSIVEVEVTVPPSVKARFMDGDEEQRGANIVAFQNGVEVFRFRWMDEVFVEEGTYEFRTRLTSDNDLTVNETLAAGDHKELNFELVHTVHVTFRMVAAGSETPLKGNYDLWQDGEQKYRVHARNGAQVLPGTYEVRLDNDLNPHVEQGVNVSAEADDQQIDLVVPAAHVTFIYQKADGSRDDDKRVFVARGAEKKGRVKNSGVVHVLIPGTYNAVGWRGTYDRVVFDVLPGETKEFVLRDKG
ncbi:MAG: hypothetical protein HKN43_06950 [Rhodothermales bacterium]|nr:hypothetical protein [Rhodothermales bacterium]